MDTAPAATAVAHSKARMHNMRLNPLFQPFTQRGAGLDGLFGFSDQSLFAPSSTRVRRTETGLEVLAVLPGVAPEELEIEVEGRWLTLRGKSRLFETEQEFEGRAEGEAPGFQRRFQLPFAVDGEASTAMLENGVLTLLLTRPEADAPRRIALSPTGKEFAAELPEAVSE